MTWLYVSIIAYLLLAMANLGDKLVVTKYLSSPRVYAMSVALLQALTVFLLPFFWHWPGWQGIMVSFISGISFLIAIYYLYTALKAGEASRVVPTIDSSAPIIILIISFFLFSEQISGNQILAILLLIMGGFLLSYQSKAGSSLVIKYVLLSALAFAISQITAKIIFTNQPFLSAFIWARVGAFVAIIPLLLKKKYRDELRDNFTTKDNNTSSKVVLFTQVSGGAGFFLQNYAIKLGEVSIVSAIQAMKYLFLFLLLVLFSKKFNQLKEDWNRRVLLQKIGGVVFVVFGLVVLVL